VNRATKAQWAEARRMWIAGESPRAIAAMLGLGMGAIYYQRSSKGWPKRKTYVAPSRIDWTRGRQLWDAGAPTAEIAAALGVQVTTIHSARNRLDWPMRRCPMPSAVKWPDALPMWTRGESVHVIAAFVGVTTKQVYKYGAKHGWPKRELPRVVKAPKAPRKPRAESRPVVMPTKGRPCPCGSHLSRLVLVDGAYVHRCETCVPDWWARRVAA
jgi:uncharacterized protein YjcR